MRGTHRTRWWQLAIAVAAIPVLLYAFAEGPPSETTGGFGEDTCVFCHIGSALNSGQGSVTITAPASYTSGQTYTITVRVADPQRTNGNQSRWGFELSARTQGGQQAGSLAPTNNQTQLAPTFNGVQYIEHTTIGTRAGTPLGVNFTFRWTAPDTSAGPVVMHAAGNSANNSQSELGDRIYSTSVTIPPEVSAPAPDVFSGGVLNNASFALDPAPKAPGTIVAIFGANLNDGSQNPNPPVVNSQLQTSLGGSSVTIDGIPAPIFYSFPGQVAVQIPYEVAGHATADVVVTTAGGQSTPRTIILDAAAPGIFTLNQQGSGQGAILLANSATLAAPAGSIPGVTSQPVQRGGFITIFCTGLGVVTPPVATGALSPANPTPVPATATIDGLAASVSYSGTAPGFVGLDQVNVQVPQGSSVGNNIPVVITLNGRQSNTATIAVAP